MTATSRVFDHYYGQLRHFQDSVLVGFDSTHGIEIKDTSKHIVLLRSIFTFEEKRGQAYFSRAMQEILRCSEESGCCVLAISNPFEMTVPEYLRDNKSCYAEETWLRYVQDFEEPQQKQTDRFQRLGFQQIDISESIQDQNRCPPEHCLIYVPVSSDGDFVERLKPRLLLSP